MFAEILSTTRKRGSRHAWQQRRQRKPIFESLEPRVFMSVTPLQAVAQHTTALSAPTRTSAVAPVRNDASTASVGLYDPTAATFYLSGSDGSEVLPPGFAYGPANAIPIVGDWSGDGIDTVGWYDPSTAAFSLASGNAAGTTTITTFVYGPADSGMLPVVGDWNGDGTDTVGLYNPTTATFYLRNSNTSGFADTTFMYGSPSSGMLPVAGDWTGDGTDTVGLYSPTTSLFYLKNSNTSGFADMTFMYGPARSGWKPITGDWTGAGTDTVGLYNPGTSTFFLKNSNTAGFADTTFIYGSGNRLPAWVPLAGSWSDGGANFLGLKDAKLAALVQSLDADGSVSRNDMIQILRSVDTGNISATAFADLGTIVADAAQLNMPDYVQVLAADVVNGNPANARYQGQTLGNLAAGSSAAVLGDLIDKWFLGTDVPLADAGTGGSDYGYALAAGSLFVGSPSHNDEFQGYLGDCYLITSLGSVADVAPAAIRNMFLDNGDGTWTVRFYANGTADYVTVNGMLPVDSTGCLVYADCGCLADSTSNVLWIPLAEKAYVQWDETGREGRGGINAYSDIEGGWMADVYTQLVGRTANFYNLVTESDEAALTTAMTNHWAVSIGTDCDADLPYGIYGCHAYAIIGYDSNAGTFTLYNPWGCDQPTTSLTWAQLQSVCDGFCTVDPAGTEPINLVSASAPAASVVSQPWTRSAGNSSGQYARAADVFFRDMG